MQHKCNPGVPNAQMITNKIMKIVSKYCINVYFVLYSFNHCGGRRIILGRCCRFSMGLDCAFLAVIFIVAILQKYYLQLHKN